jgi:hypothetical protein
MLSMYSGLCGTHRVSAARFVKSLCLMFAAPGYHPKLEAITCSSVGPCSTRERADCKRVSIRVLF